LGDCRLGWEEGEDEVMVVVEDEEEERVDY